MKQAHRSHIGTIAAALLALAGMSAGAMAQPSAAKQMSPAYLDRYEAQKTKVVLPNQQALAFLDMGPRDASPVVLIHGYTDSSWDWAPLAPQLAQFRLIIVDLRGHGASGKPECCYSRFDFAYDVKLLLDTLHIPQADIVGHSLGSLVAQAFAQLWPQSTRRLILISSTGTSFGTPQAPVASWMTALESLKDPIDPDSAFMRDWWRESVTINPEFFHSRQRRAAAAIPARLWRAIGEQTLLGTDLSPMLAQIRAPTLVIWGERENLVPEAGREALLEGIANVKSRIFPGLGHDLFWEDPPAVAAVMIDFLTKQQP